MAELVLSEKGSNVMLVFVVVTSELFCPVFPLLLLKNRRLVVSSGVRVSA